MRARESAEVLKVATPDPFRAPVPNVVVPSLKVTVPVGVPVPGKVTIDVAVKVTDWPNTDGFADGLTVVVVRALFTVWVNTEEVLPV